MLQNSSTRIAQTADLLNTLFRLCKHLSLYSEENAVVVQTTDKLLHELRQLQEKGENLQITVSKHGFLFDGEFLNQKNLLFKGFARRMFQLGISSFTLTSELTVPSIYLFLQLIMRNAAEIWDEGGIGAKLEEQKVRGILITEMSESDFHLLNADHEEEPTESLQRSADPWGKLSRSLAKSFAQQGLESTAGGDLTPAELAARISTLLVGKSLEEKGVFTRQLTRFVATLQREKIKTSQTEAILCLADFINHLSDELRTTLMKRICNLQLATEYAEDFLSGLSDKVILESFQEATAQPGYTTPVVMSLIGKLAGTRKLASGAELTHHLSLQKAKSERIRALFRPDEFKKYVPSRYQQVLLQVLNKQRLPSATTSKLEELKKSLEDFQQERQVVRLSMHILDHEPEAEALAVLRERLLKAMQTCLEAADFASLIELCRLCFADRSSGAALYLAGLIPPAFIQQVLKYVPALGKDHLDDIAQVIELIGLPFVAPLIEATTQESDRSIRFFYFNCLKKLGPQVTDAAVLALKDEQWFVQRNMLILLGELGATDKLPQIKPLLKHSNPKIRQEALKTCLLLQDASSVKDLMLGLSSRNKQEALHAIALCQLLKTPETTDKLLRMLQENELFRFDYEKKKALVQALADHQSPQVLKTFTTILKSRKIFKADLYRKLQVEIVKVLGKYPADQVANLLHQLIDGGEKDLANQARQTLKKFSQEDL
jgi:hypothetical protein